MADISDIDDSVPIGTSDPKQGDNEIKQLKTDTKGSFPGFTNNTTAVVTDATLGDATGPEIAYAAKNFNSTAKAVYDGYAISIGTNATGISDLETELTDVVTAVHFGVITGGASTFIRTPGLGTWGVTNSSTGIYDVTHDQGTLYPVATAVTTSTARIVVQVVSVGVGTFQLRVRSNVGQFDPTAITFIAL